MSKLNKIFVVGVGVTILGFLIQAAQLLYPSHDDTEINCQAEDYKYCRNLLENYTADKLRNRGTPEDIFNEYLKERYNLTEDQIQNLAENFREYSRTEYDKALALSSIKMYDEAILHFENAIRLENNNIAYYYNKVIVQALKGDYESALTTIDKAIEVFGNDTQSFLYLKASILNEKGLFNRSVELYDYLLSINPNDPFSWNDRGVALAKQGRYEKSIESFNKALEFSNFNRIVGWDNKAISMIWLGRYEEAVDLYSKILEIIPDYQKGYDNRGYAYFQLGKYEQTFNDWNRSLILDGNEPSVCKLYNLGLVLPRMGELDTARDYFERAYNISPNFVVECSPKLQKLIAEGFVVEGISVQ